MAWKSRQWDFPLLVSVLLVSHCYAATDEISSSSTAAAMASSDVASSSSAAPVTTTTTTTTTEKPLNDRVQCYACGQSMIDPTLDGEDYYDLEKLQPNQAPGAGSKMYNHTCDIMDRLGASSHWIRTCPEGVKSCFFAEGTYELQSAIFRGCAGAKYPHDKKCDRELQAVQVVAGKKSVDVEVFLCYCNEQVCNLERGNAKKMTAGLLQILTVFLLAQALH